MQSLSKVGHLVTDLKLFSKKNCSWLPDHVTLLASFADEPTPIKSTVTKAVAEFRRTHADTWNIQKDSFTEEQLEVMHLILGFTLSSFVYKCIYRELDYSSW